MYQLLISPYNNSTFQKKGVENIENDRTKLTESLIYSYAR